MLKIKLLLVFCLSALLTGCFTPMSVARMNKEQGEKGEYYAFAIATKDMTEEVQEKLSPCFDLKQYDSLFTASDNLWFEKEVCPNASRWVVVSGNFYGLNGTFIKMSVLAPKSANVESGDIIKFSRDTSVRMANQFLYIAAKASERDAKKCDWVGSKILNFGGVECEGWSYKSMPVFK